MPYAKDTKVRRMILLAGAGLMSSAAWAQQEVPAGSPHAAEASGLEDIPATATPVPFSKPLEDAFMVGSKEIVAAAKALLAYK